jgi:hypothetical protein
MARTGADALKPSCVRKMRIVTHTGQNGRNDGQQIMVDRGHAFIGMSAPAASASSTCAIRQSRKLEGTGLHPFWYTGGCQI